MGSEKALKQPLLEKANGKDVDDEQEVKKGERPGCNDTSIGCLLQSTFGRTNLHYKCVRG